MIKSYGTHFKGRGGGNIGVRALDENGKLIHDFSSIKECALFFNVHSRTIIRKLENGSFMNDDVVNGINLSLKRKISDVKIKKSFVGS